MSVRNPVNMAHSVHQRLNEGKAFDSVWPAGGPWRKKGGSDGNL